MDRRTYWFDPYLKDVYVKNPVPVVSHKEALQLIANAGRCVLYQDRSGNLIMKSSFVPDMTASSGNETYFSNAAAVLEKSTKASYALASENYTDVVPTGYFLPRESSSGVFLNTGFISESVAGEDGTFEDNPVLTISMEASFKCFGMTMEFGDNHPAEMVFHSYLNGVLQEDYFVSGLETVTTINHEFPEFDCLILEFIKGVPNNRVILNMITFGEGTDYELTYGTELTKTPRGTQLPKVRELQIVRTVYSKSDEVKELLRESIEVVSADSRYTFYLTNPSYELSCSIVDAGEGQTAEIVESSNYFVTVEITGAAGNCELSVTGKEYVVTRANVSRQLNTSGSRECWENPLVSDIVHAADLADWIGNYMASDREYDLEYRGEPRIDTNDIMFLENKYVPDLLLRVCDHTLKFNGAFSGTIKARRDMSNVAAAKNRLADRR